MYKQRATDKRKKKAELCAVKEKHKGKQVPYYVISYSAVRTCHFRVIVVCQILYPRSSWVCPCVVDN